MKKRLSKTDLGARVLKRIRAREGCEGVSKVVLEEKFDENSDCNWDILVVDTIDTADQVTIGPAILEVYDT